MRWLLIFQGIVSILFGLLAFSWPGLTLATLVLFVGLYLFISGIFGLIAGLVSVKENKNWWILSLEGLFGILAGVITFTTPGITAFFLFVLVLVWAFIVGFAKIGYAFSSKSENSNWWLYALSGAASVIIGFMLIFAPVEGLLVVAWVIGFYALFSGITSVAYGIKSE